MTRHSRDTPQFYLTAPSTCPYLPGRQERKVFTHLVGERAADLNDLLTQGGFRRSQSIAYRPACENCRACVSVRVLVDEFRPTRSLRRVRQRNADVSGEMRVATPTSEQFDSPSLRTSVSATARRSPRRPEPFSGLRRRYSTKQVLTWLSSIIMA